MDYRTGFRDGYNAAREDIIGAFGSDYLPSSMEMAMSTQEARALDTPSAPRKKRASAYSRKYKTNFRKIAKDYKKKNGKWKKNGFKTTVKKAHESTRKGMVRKTARRAYKKK